MRNFVNTAQSNVVNFDSILPEGNTPKNQMEILNAGIKELREAGVDIQRISFFEEPLAAIIQIKNEYTPPEKLSWLKDFSLSKPDKTSMLCLKLQVRRQSNSKTPYFLKCEMIPNLM